MITRFAPSPTGFLHLGHALSALTVWQVAEAAGGVALLRIEDTDSTRCRPEYEAAIYEDLAWLGLSWPAPVRRQSEHADDYEAALARLGDMGLLYPCSCSRTDIASAGATPGLDGLVYPGTCRARPLEDARPGDALRLDLAAALARLDRLPTFTETGPLHPGRHTPDPARLLAGIGDPVLRRKESGDAAYHLACTHDDALQEVSHVVRGADLWHATFLQVVLQALMGWPTPAYHHHRLIRDEGGKRLAKRDDARALRTLREEGATPDEIRSMVGL